MKRYIKVSALVFMLAVLVGAPVNAQAPGGQSDNRPDSAQQAHSNHDSDNGAEARESAEERRERIQAEAEERREEVQQRVCEQRQEQLQEIIPRLGTSATTLLDTMDGIYEQVQEFYESDQLTVENYDELNEEVASAQADAEAAVAVVEGYEFELDCEDPNLGQQLDGFRQAVTEAREELMEYREALVNLIQELRAEAAEEESDEEDGSNSEQQEANSEQAGQNSEEVDNDAE